MLSSSALRDGQQNSNDQPSQEERENRCTHDDLPLSSLDDRTQDLRQRGFEWGNGADLLEPQPHFFFLGRGHVQMFDIVPFSSGDARRPSNRSIARVGVGVPLLRLGPIIAARMWTLRVIIRVVVIALQITRL